MIKISIKSLPVLIIHYLNRINSILEMKFKSLLVIINKLIINWKFQSPEKEMSTPQNRVKISSSIETEDDCYIEPTVLGQMPKTLSSIASSRSKRSHRMKGTVRKNSQYSVKNEKCESYNALQLNGQDDGIIDQKQKNQFQNTLYILKMKQKQMRTRTEKKRFDRSSIRRDRVNKICQNFINKVRRTNVSKNPLLEEDLIKYQTTSPIKGFKPTDTFLMIFDLMGIMTLVSLMLFQTIAHAYPQINEDNFFVNYLYVTIFYHILEIALGFFTQKKEKGKKILNLSQISRIYMKNQFILDTALTIVLIAYLYTKCHPINDILLFLLPFKIPKLLKKLEIIQKLMLTNFYYERYVSVIKIILFNFAFAHLIAILLSLMVEINPNANWQIVKNISNTVWFQRYVWSYYWATTIMLTIGFGDFVPTTYQQAICLIFIEIFSCIAFSYNISCLGSIIGGIREQNEQIDKSRKVFEALSRKKGFSEKLTERIENYIDQSLELKTKFNIQEEKQLIEQLPAQYKKELISQSNINALKGLTFFGGLLKRTIYKLSEKMEAQIYTPEQIVIPIHSMFAIYILESGELTYVCSNDNFNLSNIAINSIKINEKNKPFLVNIDFLTMRRSAYSVKSTVYSAIQKLSYVNFIQAMQTVSKDYEYYCFLRDQSKHRIDEYETIKCSACGGKHTLFDCPKYHFMPLKEAVIIKYLHKMRNEDNTRNSMFYRAKRQVYKPLKHKIYNINQTIATSSHEKEFSVKQMKQQKLYKYLLSSFWRFTEEIELSEDDNLREQFSLLKIIGLALTNAKESFELNGYDQVTGSIKIDKAHNYDIYFPKSNSSELHFLELKQKRLIVLENSITFNMPHLTNQKKGKFDL